MDAYAKDLIRVLSLVISFCAICFGIPGNVFVIHIIRKHPRFRTVHNLFHASLAMADLTTCLIGTPSFLLAWCFSAGDTAFRGFMCTLSVSLATTCNLINIITLMKISIVRVYVVYKQKYSMSKKTGVFSVAVTWGAGMLSFLVYIIKGPGPIEHACAGSTEIVDAIGDLPVMILFFFIPALAFLALMCIGSYVYLLRQAKRMRNLIHPITTISHIIHSGHTPPWWGNDPNGRGRSGQGDDTDVNTEPLSANFIANMAATSSILTMVYVLSTLPTIVLSVMQIWQTIPAPIVEMCFVPLYFSMFLNPYIYASRNRFFKHEFHKLILKCLQ
ncbi:alpha-1A adrenergic receptor [Lingula anatina]|uniref:Alpha-1A adrenergic receptor n=1 Tax=Lingula anatina TaxID=7574 RepID=A0A1S3HCD3_LINAN|nr:alpha-1A adrenergic receptor [Lingula anatina]XP_013383674.1 alpha-1A adrenergic receptor [Lingula anatina]XP_013383675.1 alpha-1A adrenergic receptor [Lingula anatina]XP_013383676.1 alpha-1A adrenergic receptor [Lingula anatina]XP_013383677.1 alpha-1A adrenergic receptor [Lingula anatina]XP_013383679.1 alpha-1A adrenergic receptor [Lingula anatina]|eukprot:XP_013383673.1 alpha-1A adrenergic receptor [Lingula anatina]